jgi:type IV pilus assembly protein PilE
MKKSSSQGFTLIEVLMVVVIIGILATIAIPSYTNSIERSKCSQGMHTLKNLRNAALEFYRVNETFVGMDIPGPGGLEELVSADFDSLDSNSFWDFSVPNTGATTFTLRATRENGPHGGESIDLDQNGVMTENNYPISTYFPN